MGVRKVEASDLVERKLRGQRGKDGNRKAWRRGTVS